MATVVKEFHSVNGTPVDTGTAGVADVIEVADDPPMSQVSEISGEFWRIILCSLAGI